ncbi:SAM-dependent methyltransferase [Streptomyces sp. NPDC051018]|uniref:SAM-dependent methyltransferase n=1 Tax=Streptomyces sp. NPDC051018 TaxID=3365639 RepID=UPI0037A20ED7
MTAGKPTAGTPEQGPERAEFDTGSPCSARVWNYWLGGTDNYPVDREVGESFRVLFPGIVDLARDSRGFLSRAVTHLAGEAGIRQFLDVGSGLPTADNTHQIAQRVAPEARVVCADNDPLVLAQARTLLVSTPEGVTDCVGADLNDPGPLVRKVWSILDPDEPVALILMQVVGHIAPYDRALSIVNRLMAALPSGSYLVLNDSVDTHRGNAEATRLYNDSGAAPYHLRGHDRISGFFEGLELLDPGVVPPARWRPAPGAAVDGEVIAHGGVGRKP